MTGVQTCALPICQPLALDSSRKSSAKILIALGLLLLLILIGGGAALFAFKDQIFHLAFNKQETSQKVVEAQGEDKLASSTPPQGQESSLPPANASTPDSTASSEDKVMIAPTETPAPLPSPTADQDKRKVVAETTPPRTDSDASPATGAEIQPPATLTKSQVDATREDVLKRINAMPKFTAEEKKRLGEKMQTARSMERLLVARFDTGQTALSRAAADDLMKRIKSPAIEDKVSDPTVVFVVAGYADAAGDPKTNLQISQQRADNVTKVLKEKTNLLNVIHSVGMGSTALLDSKRPDQNRAVEIWAVAP